MDNELQIDLAGIDKVYAESNGLNLPLVREAVRQTELKVQDEYTRQRRIDTRAYISCLLLERNLLSYLLDKNGVPHNAKDRFLLSCEVDHVLDRIKDQIHKEIKSHKKESKASASNFPLKKGGRA